MLSDCMWWTGLRRKNSVEHCLTLKQTANTRMNAFKLNLKTETNCYSHKTSIYLLNLKNKQYLKDALVLNPRFWSPFVADDKQHFSVDTSFCFLRAPHIFHKYIYINITDITKYLCIWLCKVLHRCFWVFKNTNSWCKLFTLLTYFVYIINRGVTQPTEQPRLLKIMFLCN